MGGHKSQSTTPVRLNAIQVNQSAYGNCVPLLYGTSRLPITLIDYVDFKATPVSQSTGGGKGGGSQTTSSYNYSATIVALICEGPISGLTQTYLGSSLTTLAAQNLSLFAGAGSQPVWSYMTQFHPDHAIPYDHMAYVAGANYSLGSQAGLPNLTFEVQGLLLWNGVDSHPAQIIPDYCQDPNHGVGFPYLAPLSGPNSYASYCTAMGFFISPCETTQRSAQDFVSEILQVTNSNSVWSPGTGLRIVPYADAPVSGNGDSYTPNLTPIYAFVDDDYIYTSGQAPIQRSITPANQTFNVWRVEFLDRSNQYNTAIAEFRDEVDVSQNGLRVASTVSLHSITTRPVALTVATLLCLRNLYIRSTFTFSVRADYSLLEPMDLVAINDSTAGIVDQLVRITDINDDANDVITITAEEMIVGPASAPLYDTQFAQAFAANYQADPGQVSTPYIFTAPPLLVDPNGGYEIWIAVAGTSGLWGGADVYASLDNQTYDHMGTIISPARYGAVLATLPLGNDPDTSNVLQVQLNTSTAMTMVSATRAAADNLRTLSIVDGEVISYENVTPLGNNTFSLSYLRRGQYNSPIGQHLSGSFFAVIDGAIFRMPFDPGMSGQPVWFKFVSFNYFGGGREDISKVTAYQAFFQGQNNGQLLPNGDTPLIARNFCVNVGSRIFKNPTGTAGWDSDCYSKDAFASACTMHFTASQTNLYFMMGLDTNPTSDESYTSINFAWYPNADGNAYIYENGSLIFSTGPYTTSTKFEIRYDGKYVTYYRDSVQWRTVPAPGKVFFLDSSFYSPGSAADNVFFGALNPANSSPFVARGNCTVSDENVQKIGGVNGWDSDVYSLEGYPSCHITFKANGNCDAVGGLTLSPGSAAGFQQPIFFSVEFGFILQGNGSWREIIRGAIGGVPGTYDSTTRFAVTYDGNTYTMIVNGAVVDTHGPDALSVNNIPFMQCAVYEPGAGLNTVQYGPTTQLQLTDTFQIGLNAASGLVSLEENGIGSGTISGSSGTSFVDLGIGASITSTAGNALGIDAQLDIQFRSFTGSPTATIMGLSAFSLQIIRIAVGDVETLVGSPFDLHSVLQSTTMLQVGGQGCYAGHQLATFTLIDVPAADVVHPYTYGARLTWTTAPSAPSVAGDWFAAGGTIKIREYKR